MPHITARQGAIQEMYINPPRANILAQIAIADALMEVAEAIRERRLDAPPQVV